MDTPTKLVFANLIVCALGLSLIVCGLYQDFNVRVVLLSSLTALFAAAILAAVWRSRL